MNTQFSLGERTLTLTRYPAKHQHKSLQAWDSADELLIEHIEQEGIQPQPNQLAIFNDDCGALGCWFHAVSPHWVSDSWVSHLALQENLTNNTIAYTCNEQQRVNQPLNALDSMAPIPTDTRLFVIKVPKTLALLEQQLSDIAKVMTPTSKIIAAGKIKMITRSVLSLFERYIGTTTTSLASKKSRLIFAQPTINVSPTAPYPTVWDTPASNGRTLKVSNYANVFSRQSLDIGARVLMEHMHISSGEHVVDLGCGNGILGLNTLALAPDARVTFVDESFMALASAEKNVVDNFPEQRSQARFVASNALETLLNEPNPQPVDRILCNPPFHQNNTVTDHIAWQMFNDAKALLRRGGHLIVVGNRHLDYHQKLKRVFGGVKLIASDRKFVILAAAKR